MNQNSQNQIIIFFVKLFDVLALFFLAVLFIFKLLGTWRKWPDILVDFGRELYIPWQISSGKILYKDIAHLFGPLSQYTNALLFKLFGASYTTIIIANTVVLVCFISLLYLFIKRSCSRLTAFLACGVVLSVFSFSQYVGVGNYNFISPYSHEATHGILLSLLMIYQLWRFTVSKRKRDLALAGLIFGLIFLTKVDILFSAAVVISIFFFLDWSHSRDLGSTAKSGGVFFACSCIPIFVFFGYFMSVIPFGRAVRAVCGSWIGLLGTGVTQNSFYIRSMGLDNPAGNVLTMILHTVIVIITIVTVFFLSYSLRKYKDKLFFVCICSVLLIVTISLVFFVNLYEAGRSLPLLTFAAFLFLLYSYFRLLKSEQEKARILVPMLLWSVFSLCMLWKMTLSCKLFHYGFYLALPSVVLLVSMLVWYLPEWLEKKYSGSSVFRIVMVIIIVIFSIKFIQTSNKFFKVKTYSIGAGGDRIVTYDPKVDSRSPLTAQAVEWIHTNLNEKETFVVLPEGVMINYLTKRANPTPYTNFMMPEMLTYGEGAILDAFKSSAPDYFVLVHKNTLEYGVGFFGQDPRYGKKIIDWINKNYHPVCLFGREPLIGMGFGIKILRRGKREPVIVPYDLD